MPIYGTQFAAKFRIVCRYWTGSGSSKAITPNFKITLKQISCSVLNVVVDFFKFFLFFSFLILNMDQISNSYSYLCNWAFRLRKRNNNKHDVHILDSSLSISTQFDSFECALGLALILRAWKLARDYAYLIELTCIGNQSNAKAATTMNTNLVTRFRPRCVSFVRFGRTVRHNRNIHAYSPIMSINGIKYELKKNIIWKAANDMPPLLNTHIL